MSNLKELKTQIENANALGIANLTEKGVEIPETATTYDIMSKIAEVVGGSGKEEQEKTITITENSTTEILPDENKALSKVTVVTDVSGSGSVTENNCTLLLHCDDFIDSGKHSHPLINKGVDIDTTVKKFGSGSMLFNSTSDYVDIDKRNFYFADNDFTIDFWAFPTAFTGMILASWGNLGEYAFGILTSSRGELQFAYGVADGSSRKTAVLSTGSYLNLNVWQHIAITRTNDTLYFFINGNLVYSVAFTVPLLPPVNNLWLGKNNDNTFFGSDRYTGYLDEIRIINGECMWTEAFTPPEEPYIVETESGIELLDHTVTFTVDGEPYEIVSVKNGNSVNAPATEPTKEGYNILVWQNKNNETILFPYEIQSNEELTALFIKETVRLNSTMTSDTEPSGECFADSVAYSSPAWKAFRNEDLEGSVGTIVSDIGHHWVLGTPIEDAYIGYDFGAGVSYNIDKVVYYPCFYKVNTNQGATVKIQGSNNKTEWEDISKNVYIASTGYSTSGAYLSKNEIPCNSTKAYRYVRVKPVDFPAGNGTIGESANPCWYNRQIEIYGF